MKSKQLHRLGHELAHIFVIFLVLAIALKIVFFKETSWIILKLISSVFYIMILPGYFIMLYWIDKISFSERFILGAVVGTVIVGTISYHLGIIGLNIKYHFFPVPIGVILISTILYFLYKE